MPVNRPQPASPPPASADGRLYLRDQDLNEGAAVIRAAARRLGQLVESAGASANLSGPEMDVLQEIFDQGPLDVGDLRARLGAPKQSLARNLNQLEARNLVKRETDPEDRRRRLVTLTTDGLTFTREATERRRTALRQAFLSAGPDAVTGARRVLAELLRVRGEFVSQHKSHILVVDDDDRLRDLLKRYLAREGHDATTAKDSAHARRLMQTMSFDLIVLDVMMPGEDGLSLLRSIREKVDTPVILLTARGQPAERIEGLKLGADDYLPKPFEPEELTLRIGSILKRAVPEAPLEEIMLSGMVFHVGKSELRRDGRLVRLTESETQLLSILAQRAGAAISRQELAVLTAAGVERSVDVQVTRLRRKIERDPREPVHLQTVRGVGYRLTGD